MRGWAPELSRSQEYACDWQIVSDRRAGDILRRSFVTAHLLLGNIMQAEKVTMEVIDLWNSDQAGVASLQTTLMAAVQPYFKSCPSGTNEQDAADSYLPAELRRVLMLAPAIRRCFVLRVLIGLPAQICSQMLDLDIQQIDQYSAAAIECLSVTDPL